MEKLLTVRQSAEALNLSIHTIRAWIIKRRLGYVKLGKSVRIPISEIKRVIQEGTVHPIHKEHAP